jgi:hypothetical protein
MLLGTSKATVGNYGFLVVSIANALANYAIDKAEKDGDLTPAELVTRLSEGNCFELDGNLRTQNVDAIIPKLYRLERIYTTVWPAKVGCQVNIDTAISRIRRLLRIGQPVILHVDATKWYTNLYADHFVLLVSDDWTIVDPWDGKRVNLIERYGQPDKTIQGYLSYVGSAIQYEENGDQAAGQAAFKLTQVMKQEWWKKQELPLKFYIKEALDHLING